MIFYNLKEIVKYMSKQCKHEGVATNSNIQQRLKEFVEVMIKIPDKHVNVIKALISSEGANSLELIKGLSAKEIEQQFEYPCVDGCESHDAMSILNGVIIASNNEAFDICIKKGMNFGRIPRGYILEVLKEENFFMASILMAYGHKVNESDLKQKNVDRANLIKPTAVEFIKHVERLEKLVEKHVERKSYAISHQDKIAFKTIHGLINDKIYDYCIERLKYLKQERSLDVNIEVIGAKIKSIIKPNISSMIGVEIVVEQGKYDEYKPMKLQFDQIDYWTLPKGILAKYDMIDKVKDFDTLYKVQQELGLAGKIIVDSVD